jgi:prefoldin subunit 5
MKIFFLLCCVVALVLVCAVSGLTQDTTTPTAISSRIAELTPPDKDIPDNPIVLADEIRRINEELDEIRKSEDSFERQIKNLNQTKDRANKALQEISSLNCDASPANLPSLMDEIDRVTRPLANPIDDDTISPWANVSTRDIRTLAPKEQCEKLKAITSDPDLATFIDKQQNQLAEIKGSTDQLLDALQKRRAALVTHNQVAETKQDIFQYLWVIIGVIGMLSIGTIFVIRSFPPALQEQWVASGQVIQFVTVMILLSVIMALGLASILKENTLGTLLGGIAGYVLSQGVGRAAAQAVKEGILRGGQQQAAGSPPPTLAAITPNTGPAAGGTAVIITGTGFDSVTHVTFGGAPATITHQTSTALEVNTPAGRTGVVDVVVTTRDGHDITASFTYT